MQTFQIGLGLAIVLLTFFDFFHTTLSGKGFGWLSGILNRHLNRIILSNQNRKIFDYSGMIHLLFTTFVWLSLLFLGTYLVFTSGEEMVMNAETRLPATYVERFYFVAYLLSTLGIGDFVPGNDTSDILAGIFSFSGFILITTGMTYLLGVVNSVLTKKELAFFISTLGKDVVELYDYFSRDKNLETLMSDSTNLREQIIKNSSSYLAFPMVNYFLTRERGSELVVQLARLYEVLVILRLDWGENTKQHAKITTIINVISKYLVLGLENPHPDLHRHERLGTLRSYWKDYGHEFPTNLKIDRQFTSSLRFSGWDWEDVYKYPDQK